MSTVNDKDNNTAGADTRDPVAEAALAEAKPPQHIVEIAALKDKLFASEKKVSENWDLYVRALAEVENVRQRARIEQDKAVKFSNTEFIRELLHVIDSLEHGLVAAEQTAGNNADANTQIASLREGITLTHKLFLDTLNKFNVVAMNPLGEKFNPAFHEALTMQEVPDAEPNTIIMVAQKGYMQHDRVIRSAKVIVAKGGQSKQDTPGAQNIDIKV